MERPTTALLRVGDWCVNSTAGEISRAGETARLDARAMRLLLCLAEHPGVVSIDELLNLVWAGVTVSPDSVYQAVASLRRQLGDDPKQPTYIATVPRLGYRLLATVGPWTEHPTPTTPSKARFSWAAGAAVGLALVAALVVGLLLHGKAADNAQAQKSIAVLPFLDLTEGMKEETFADGMTEELIGRLSKIPGLRVPSPTSSFYFKGKQLAVAEIAKTLGVAYVLDGSVRKSGERLRVAARLIRAGNGYIVWTESYDRPLVDILMVQDDIAGEVIKALKASIDAVPAP